MTEEEYEEMVKYTMAVFRIQGGRIRVYLDNSRNTTWTPQANISRDKKRFSGNGWTIEIKSPTKRKRGEISCVFRFDYYGTIITRRQKFPLEDGTLLIKFSDQDENGYYYADFETINLTQRACFQSAGKEYDDFVHKAVSRHFNRS